MLAWMNSITLLGTIGSGQPRVRHTRNSTAHASFTLLVSELVGDGKMYTTPIPVECYGSRAEAASALAPGMLVAIAGKLSRRQRKGGAWAMHVYAQAITVVD
jgi:single-stranded DNA-binding protein